MSQPVVCSQQSVARAMPLGKAGRAAPAAAVVEHADLPASSSGGPLTSGMALPVTTTGSMSAMHGYTRAGSDMARVADESRVHELLLQP